VNTDDLIAALVATLHDGRLSRTERRALREVLAAAPLDEPAQRQVEAALFDAAAAALADPRDAAVIAWLRASLAALREVPAAAPREASRAWFGPDEPMAEALTAQLAAARAHIDACVFTITDDRVADALLAAHARSVRVRIVTDDEKSADPGSDIGRLERAGIEVRSDRGPAWMHHKFAVLDGERLLTGSYNWTRQAARENHENLLVSSDPALVHAYAEHFERLWARFGFGAG
jgi:phosphatidylserine/phosphatidylglycerophosphate/cardiolipin synthase-like enzyme